MKSSATAAWWACLPYLLGAVLFFVGAARFLAHDDDTGAVIYGAAALLAFWQAANSYVQAGDKTS